jgi:hypothetical protein
MKHSLERTNAKGIPGVFVCVLCGKPDLPAKAALEDCENVRGLTQERALVEAILGPGHAGEDDAMPEGGYSEGEAR